MEKIWYILAGILLAELSISQVQDQPRGPWRLAFKAVHNKKSGKYDDFYDLYKSNDVLNEKNVTVMKDFTANSEPFKSSLLSAWENNIISVQAVKFALFRDGKEQQNIIFNAKGKTRNNWFDCNNILDSTYTDIKTRNIATCDLSENSESQRFAIKINSLESTPCDNITGWIYGRDFTAGFYQCQQSWPAKYSDRPFFLYSPGKTAALFKTGVVKADSIGIFLQVWDTVFKGVSGQDKGLYSLWKSEDVKNSQVVSAKILSQSSIQTYKSAMVNDWELFFVDSVKYAMYDNGVESACVVFDGRDSNTTNWFSDGNIIYSNYGDITEKKSVCSIAGDGFRRWQIRKVSGTCAEDTTWMEVLDDTNGTTPCAWDKQAGRPLFLYSKLQTAASLEKGGSINSAQIHKAPVMGVFVNGWELVFKVSSNGNLSSADSVLNLWSSNHVVNGNEVYLAKFLATKSTYKSPIVDQWSNYNIWAVKVAFYKDGVEQAFVVFDTTATSDKSKWFNCKQILYTSYTDLTSSFTGVCGAEGDTAAGRTFAITDTSGDCNTKKGWFAVLDKTNKKTCSWESGSASVLPQFLYSNQPTKMAMKDMKKADSIAIFVAMEVCVTSPCKNNGTCEDIAGGYYCHCTGGYYGKACTDKDGGYSDWGNWTTCNATCGGGSQMRIRTCDSPKPEGNGICQGDATEVQLCNKQHCPVNGNWSEWKEASNCTVECGGGKQNLSRTCDNPKPDYGGSPCVGKDTKTVECNTQHCPIDGGLSQWHNWSQCSKTCSQGVQMRIRVCDNPTPQYGGKNCTGELVESRNCTLNETCPPVDGGWTKWSDWGKCLPPCGNGTQTRDRSCTNPEPEWGGEDCTGNETETRDCVSECGNTAASIYFGYITVMVLTVVAYVLN